MRYVLHALGLLIATVAAFLLGTTVGEPVVPCPGADSQGYVLTDVRPDGSFTCERR